MYPYKLTRRTKRKGVLPRSVSHCVPFSFFVLLLRRAPGPVHEYHPDAELESCVPERLVRKECVYREARSERNQESCNENQYSHVHSSSSRRFGASLLFFSRSFRSTSSTASLTLVIFSASSSYISTSNSSSSAIASSPMDGSSRVGADDTFELV